MSVQKELQKIKSKQIDPVYLIYGEEDYLLNQLTTALERYALPDGIDEMSRSIYDLTQTSLSQIIMEAREIPFFSEKRLIFAKNPTFLTSKKTTSGPNHNLDELLDYLKSPSDTAILVFVVNGAVDGRSKVVKALKKNALVIEASELRPEETRNFVHQYLKNEQAILSPQALNTLLERTNYSLSLSMQEVEKLLLFSKNISIEDVRNLVPKSLEQNIFDLSEHVLQGNADKAILLIDDLLLNGENIIALNGILISRIRLILQTQILMKQNYPQGRIAETLGVKPYPVKLAMQQAKSFSTNLLVYIYDQLVEMDYKMKTGQMEQKLVFELTIIDITNRIKVR
ncbi:MAG: DNA polymerase III subunit delta [Streptococcaceae bacterium]|jgi:DNA polymerase-3 subunit delta|nr:DNA polymerase III subunit delta [Streptococcaceae bacterium]